MARGDTASSRCHGTDHRSPCAVKSSGSFGPIGQLSSDLSGCRIRSTSSSMSEPDSNNSRIDTHTRACRVSSPTSNPRSDDAFDISFRLRRANIPRGTALSSVDRVVSASRMCTISTNLMANDLIDVGVAITTAPESRAFTSLASMFSSTSDDRENSNVYTGLRISDENFSRITDRENGSSAPGTTCVTSARFDVSISASNGATTVVFPAPIIIWWHSESPIPTLPINVSTSSTCAFRSRSDDENSKIRNRGSYVTPRPVCFM